MKYSKIDQLQIYAADSREEMGRISGQDVASLIKIFLQEKEELNVMFAAAPSQNEVLAELLSDTEIDWSRINAFHMDEYIGLPQNSPQKFGNFLREHIFEKVPFGQIFYIDSNSDPEEECQRYERILRSHPIDICILGVGENGHLAFNDPDMADFSDNRLVKQVELDEKCRQQQVNDGCFSSISQVPKTALTVTIPGLTRAKAMFCVVPTKNKAEAIKNMLTGEVEELCPASILRKKAGAKLYLDPDAAKNVLENTNWM